MTTELLFEDWRAEFFFSFNTGMTEACARLTNPVQTKSYIVSWTGTRVLVVYI